MFLSELTATNFRIFGPRRPPRAEGGETDSPDTAAESSSSPPLAMQLTKGLNVLVGENDGGKTAVVDAIRLCILTTSNEFVRITIEDFYCHDGETAESFSITCRFDGLTADEESQYLELLTYEAGAAHLYVTLTATQAPQLGAGRIATVTRSGRIGEGPPIEGAAREALRATYLRPLRDAENELRPGRGSRLSRILENYPEIKDQSSDDFDPETREASTLTGIMSRTAADLKSNAAIAHAQQDLNSNYLSQFQIGDDHLDSEIGVVSDVTLRGVLEKLELAFTPDPSIGRATRRGLGYNNALFMAAELLLLGKMEGALLLIEEPEAHLHPQLQARIMSMLAGKATATQQVQVVITTHSPNLACTAPVDSLTLILRGQAFSLAKSATTLDDSDYNFLHRFLDTTKANLFFARSVAIVEGDAEAILLPALADAVEYSFNRYGVSVVNVGHVGLFRYSRIFQRVDNATVPVQVACFRDRDITPFGTPGNLRKKLPIESDMTEDEISSHVARLRERDGGAVRTFVSDSWTLEYDLAASSWKTACLMHAAVRVAVLAQRSWPLEEEIEAAYTSATAEVASWEAAQKTLSEAALEIYAPLRLNEASKTVAAQFAARFIPRLHLVPTDLPSYLIDGFAYLGSKVD